MVTIRDMVLQDYEAVNRLMRELHGIHVQGRPDIYRPEQRLYSREDFQKIIESDQCLAIAAEMQGEIVGICFAALREPDVDGGAMTAYLEDLCVSRETRRKGIGTMLFHEVEQRAGDRGARRLDLTVWEFNRPAAAFYEAMGMSVQRCVLEKPL